MLQNRKTVVSVTLAMIILALLASVGSQIVNDKPAPKVIKIDMQGQDYVSLLAGPPESILLRSGAVALQPGKTVGKHNTAGYEELVIVLEGEGTMVLNNQQLNMKVGTVLYCPPETEHDVQNTGANVLKYIYVVAKTK